MIYFIVVNYNSSQLVRQLVESLKFDRSPFWQMIIVNNSEIDQAIYDLENEQIKIIDSGSNIGFGRACNLGLKSVYEQDKTAVVWLINPDAYLLANSLKKADHFFTEYPEVSILGTSVYQPTGEVWFGRGYFDQTQGIIIANDQLDTTSDLPYQITDWVTGCSLLINLQNFAECPFFDPDYFLYYEDFDLCQRYIKQGHKVCLTTEIAVIHQPSSITGREPNLKLEYSIYSYLLSLEKHCSKSVLYTRLFRLALSGLMTMLLNYNLGLAKIKGVLRYLPRITN